MIRSPEFIRVADLIGYRRSGGKIITQPNCHKCRTRLSKSSKKRTGANRKKMAVRPHGHDPEKNRLRSPKFTTKVQAWLSSLLSSLAECTTLLNTVLKCDGIESGEDPKTHTFEQETLEITKIYQSRMA